MLVFNGDFVKCSAAYVLAKEIFLDIHNVN